MGSRSGVQPLMVDMPKGEKGNGALALATDIPYVLKFDCESKSKGTKALLRKALRRMESPRVIAISKNRNRIPLYLQKTVLPGAKDITGK